MGSTVGGMGDTVAVIWLAMDLVWIQYGFAMDSAGIDLIWIPHCSVGPLVH